MELGFSVDSISDYIFSEGGKVEYHKLIKRYKSCLADPSNQEARILFKDYVNAVAYVSQENNTKYLILRPEFVEKFAQSSNQDATYLSFHPSNFNHTQRPQQPAQHQHPISSHQSSPQSNLRQPISHNSQQQVIEPPPRMRHYQNQHKPVERPRSTVVMTPIQNSNQEENKRFSTTSWQESDSQPPQPPPRRRSVTLLNNQNPNQRISASGALVTATPMVVGSEAKFVTLNEQPSVDNQKENEAKPSYFHQQDKFKEIHELAFKSPGRVKEHAQKLNKIASESDIKPPMPANNNPPHHVGKNKQKENKDDDNDSASVQPCDPLKRKWMVTASNCDYNELVLLLKEDPNLAGLKDITSTALHWAAKFGKPEIIKLIAGTHGINVNKKSYGGYTPLHLAAIHNHENIMELLRIYGADASIRDHSGKSAEQYLTKNTSCGSNSAINNRSKHANGSLSLGFQHKYHSTSNNHAKVQEKSRSDSYSSAFIRIGSLNNKMRKTAAAITGIKSWGSAESVSDSNTMPPPKQASKKKRSKKALSSSQANKPLPSVTKDSDSDSAYGFG